MHHSRSTRRRFLQGMGAAGLTTVGLRSALASSFSLLATPRNRALLAVESDALRDKLAHDLLRPQYHLLPAANWMNDPNGPIYYRGQYHVFYQYNPHGAFWGTMHWGHAVSPDMIHWKHLPIALTPTPGGPDWDGCFTGSAVLDKGVPTLIYTGVTPEVQCLATCTDDNLLNWKKDPKPVIASPPAGLQVTGFRDPCPWREGDTWYLGIGSGFAKKGGAVLLYRSQDLRHWDYMHTLAEGTWNAKTTKDPVDSGEMWECPDFFALDGKHVLLYSTQRIVYWVVGTYSDYRFHEERRGVLDYGSYYAPKSMLDAQGNRILWGWSPETRSVDEQKAAGWSGSMTLPRKLSVGSDGTLRMQPIAAMAQLQRNSLAIAPSQRSANSAAESLQIRDLSGFLRIQATRGPVHVDLQPHGEGAPFATIQHRPDQPGHELTVNNISAPLPLNGEPLDIEAYLDGSILEVYANRRVAITARIYTRPGSPLQVLPRTPEAAHGLRVTVAAMQPISANRLTT